MAGKKYFDLNVWNTEADICEIGIGEKKEKISVEFTKEGCVLIIEMPYQAVYGMGERFNQVNQKGLQVRTEVFEKFCNQGEYSYCPVPFFFTDNGFGLWLDTMVPAEFNFGERISIEIRYGTDRRLPGIWFFSGKPKEILSMFTEQTGRPEIVPKWSLGIWISANRWNCVDDMTEQLRLAGEHGFPVHAAVVEAWSDEATFYCWNGGGKWERPEQLVQDFKDKGVHSILWQIPVIKKLEAGMENEQLAKDWREAADCGYCIRGEDGMPYQIPEGHWFAGSLLPDFTNPKAVEWWFSKRQYLLDMGIDGFKTDGGEFILRDDVKAFNGYGGRELRNAYAAAYVKAYSDFAGKERVLFSRAGYTAQQGVPMQWAGDQQSTWEEFRHVMTAGLSIGLSGVIFWGFDIAGFSGKLPEPELYERATQAAAFCPVMQWHSEPSGGQFPGMQPGEDRKNDRSPWNMAEIFEDAGLLERTRFWHNLRTSLLPYLYDQALKACCNGLPLMRHLAVEYPDDPGVMNAEDCFMLGDMLVAPILYPDMEGREVYLPEGGWTDFWDLIDGACGDKKHYDGGRYQYFDCGKDRIPVLVRDGGCVAMNLGGAGIPGKRRTDGISEYQDLVFFMAGTEGNFMFQDDLGNQIEIIWDVYGLRHRLVKGDVRYRVI